MTERKIKCDICHQDIDETGYVVFRQDGGYPFDDSKTILTVEHAQCGPDTGYYGKLSPMLDDPDHWTRHLSGKNWFGPNCASQWERKVAPISEAEKSMIFFRHRRRVGL